MMMNDAALDKMTPEEMDANDPLSDFRARFYFPEPKDGIEPIYFTGNSLGLMPKTAREYVDQELEDWERLAVDGHLHAKHPWLPYHEFLTEKMARVIGANPIETVGMNSLTVNLHLLMVSFYRPSGARRKIIVERGVFPSDRYAVESQIRFHGLDPAADLIEIAPREGEAASRTSDIVETIERLGDSVD